MFCSQCGHKLEDASSFCSKCGHRDLQPSNQPQPQSAPLVQQQPQYQQPAVQPQHFSQTPLHTIYTDETVVWVFRANKKVSMIKKIPTYIVFMRDRVVMAHLTKDLQKSESERLRQRIKAEGKGFIKGSAEMMRYWASYGDKYYTMNTNAILAEDPLNMA